MPLTNPNKVVTEERLSEFYGQILPYMGGMPDVLANKFSKGDLYSTNEKMIGCWVDSKPLYMKSFVETAISSGSSISIPSDIKIVSSYGSTNDTSLPYNYEGSNFISYWYDYSNNRIKFDMGSQSNKTVYLTILYTKNSDSPIAIGVDTDYSTTEKIVGTDTDGSWVYQKTFLVTTASTPTSGWTDVPGWSENITNLSKLVKVDFSGCSYSHRIDYKLNGTKLQFYEFGGLSEVIPVGSKLTLQYTKTS